MANILTELLKDSTLKRETTKIQEFLDDTSLKYIDIVDIITQSEIGDYYKAIIFHSYNTGNRIDEVLKHSSITVFESKEEFLANTLIEALNVPKVFLNFLDLSAIAEYLDKGNQLCDLIGDFDFYWYTIGGLVYVLEDF